MNRLNRRREFLKQFGFAAISLPGLRSEVLGHGHVLTAPGKDDPIFDQDRKLGIALVGLGKYSEEQLAPALEETKRCKLAAIVTGSPEKVGKWQRKYDIPDSGVYNYQNFDTISRNPEVDIVYVVLPNAMHAEFTIRAAKAGKHVICEKPMATSVSDAEAMIKACKDAGKMLSIGYRLHFEPNNLTVAKFGREKVYGEIKNIKAIDSQEMEAGVWRLDRKRSGGGPVMDLGIYCVQGAIYSMGKNPVAVTARQGPKTDKEKFATVEQSMNFTLEFPGGATADCTTSYADSGNLLKVTAEKGAYELQPAYAYEGIKGKSPQGAIDLVEVNQQALQMDDFADCVINKKQTRVPGEMGLRDVKILMAIYESARTGKKIPLNLS